EDIDLDGHIAAVAGGGDFNLSSSVALYDVADPSKPKLLWQLFGESSDYRAADIEGALLAVAHQRDGVELFDISNPANPVLLSTYQIGNDPAKTYMID